MTDKLILYQNYVKGIRTLDYMLSLISWDSQMSAPKGSFSERAKYVSIIQGKKYDLLISQDFHKLIGELYNSSNNNISDELKYEMYEMKKDIERLRRYPKEKYIEYINYLSYSNYIWNECKKADDFKAFEPVFTRIVAYKKEYLSYVGNKRLSGYNVLLDNYEPGMREKHYDKLFATMKESLLPLIKSIYSKENKTRKELLKDFSIDKQKEFVSYLTNLFDFSPLYGSIGTSSHPFTMALSPTDVRFAVNYENDLQVSIFSTLHELGHATYEKQIPLDLSFTYSGRGASSALHESQSRLFENNIGRSYDFWKKHYHKLSDIFHSELKNVPLRDFYHLINDVKPTLTRIKADELTYTFHIIIRYEIEKELFSGNLEASEVTKRYNELLHEYLGVTNDEQKYGPFQDIHWSNGLFGYFPTYVLGSCYASQIYHRMEKDIPVKELIKADKMTEINKWLRENLHKYGKTMSPKDTLYTCTKKNFDPKYHIKYLINKYSKLYKEDQLQ